MSTVASPRSAREPRELLAALQRARSRHARVRPHRALVRLEFAPYLVQALLLPALFCTLLWRFEPQLVALWREAIVSVAGMLELPLRASAREAGAGEVRLVWLFLSAQTVLPTRADLAWNMLATAVVLGATFALPVRWLPATYFLRILAAVHASAVAFFVLAPAPFPYTIPDHVLALTGGAYVLLLTIPPMLALGYYVLRVPLATKVLHTALVLGYFVAWVPVQALLHVVILKHLSVLFMPLLYFCFGALLNVLLFVALYAWAASKAPALATPPRGSPRSPQDRPA